MNIIDLLIHPELMRYVDELCWVHARMKHLGYESYQLGPYTTNDVVDELREELEEMKKDYACLAKELDGHDATECLMNLRQLKNDLRVVVQLMERGENEQMRCLAAAMRSRHINL